MKTRYGISLVTVAVLAGLGLGYVWGQHQPKTEAMAAPATSAPGGKVLYWYDPMVPAQRFDKPGKSPFMDMQLVPRYADENAAAGGDDQGVAISSRQQQNLGVRTAAAELRQMHYQLQAVGTAELDQRSLQVIPARANGLVDKLYVRANQQAVSAGQPLAQLWFPDWSAAQQQYLAVRQLGDKGLTAAARRRLELQFMPEEIIRSVEQSGQPQTRVLITAPRAGFINKLSVSEGMQVSASQPLFELASLDPLWVVVNYPASQASLLAVGSKVKMQSDSWPGVNFSGQVSELLPTLDANSRTLQARIELANPQQQLKPGMYLQVQLASQQESAPQLAIPQEALIQTGAENRVLLSDGNGHFTPVKVIAGEPQDGWVAIKQGLQAGQQVVTSGQFLIDSEASLRSALPQMAGDMSSSPTTPAASNTALHHSQGRVEAIDGKTITLSHQAVPEINWPAMTMSFMLPASGLPAGIKVGSQVNFAFSLDDSGAKISQISQAGAPS